MQEVERGCGGSARPPLRMCELCRAALTLCCAPGYAGSSLHEAVESPVLLPLLLQHVLDPTTSAVQQQLPAEGGEPEAVPEGEEMPAPPPPPRPLDFSRPVASSASKLQARVTHGGTGDSSSLHS